MGKISLIIMAAGIGSRFGKSIKQLEPVGPNNETIMEYSIYDALEAGFNNIVFVIRKEIADEFKINVGNRIAERTEVHYVYQELQDIPKQYQEKFGDRTKPWGTGQAILSCKDIIKEPFIVINADDYYGKKAFVMAYDFLVKRVLKTNTMQMCMVGFALNKTLSDNGRVTRGICKVDADELLTDIVETKNIYKKANEIVSALDVGEQAIDGESIVSMNMWGAPSEFVDMLEVKFENFLKTLDTNSNNSYLNSEFLLPTIIGEMLEKKEAEVKVLYSSDKWFGVTYKEDKDTVVEAIGQLVENKVYPERLQ